MRDPRPAEGKRRRPRIDLSAFIRLTELADYFVPLMIRAVASLGVADHLAQGPRPVAALARETRTHAPSLYRALRALACCGVFAELTPGTFALTPLADLLRTDHPLSLRDAYRLTPADLAAWADLRYSLCTGASAFEHVHGQSLRAYLAARPAESAQFNRSMQALTRAEIRGCLAAYDWARIRTVVDVGGGSGAFLATLRSAYPAMHGVLVDQPDAGGGAAAVLEESGADAYVFNRVLYRWDDQQAVHLLGAVRAAMTRQSRILVIEPVAGTGDGAEPGPLLDVVCLVMDGGRVRREDEFAELFRAAGLALAGVTPAGLSSIVEGRLLV